MGLILYCDCIANKNPSCLGNLSGIIAHGAKQVGWGSNLAEEWDLY